MTLLGYVIIFFCSMIGVHVYRNIAEKKTILDLPNERSSHSKPTPRGGGIVIAILWFIVLTQLFLNGGIERRLFFALLCGLPICLIGLADDVFNIPPKARFLIHVTASSAAILLLGGMSDIDLGFGLSNLSFISKIIVIIAVTWFTNLFNFLDGIDGYISVEIIFIGLSSFVLFGIIPPVLLATITAGFLVWNWQPAKIFMGDAGSTLLGFTIAIFAVYYHNESDSINIFYWLMLSSLFWFDATLTLFRRWRNHETLTKAHKKHAYQRAVLSGLSHQKTVIMALVINILIFNLVWLSLSFTQLTLIFFIINMAILYATVRIIDKRYPFNKN